MPSKGIFIICIINNTIQTKLCYKNRLFCIDQPERVSNYGVEVHDQLFPPWEQGLTAERLKDYWSNVDKNGDQMMKNKFPHILFLSDQVCQQGLYRLRYKSSEHYLEESKGKAWKLTK